MTTSRRRFLAGAAAATVALPAPFVRAAPAPLRIGMLLPLSGPYAPLGDSIVRGMKLRLAEAGGRLAGREVRTIPIDSGTSPSNAPAAVRTLISERQADILVGPVHSGVGIAMTRVVGEQPGPLIIVPEAGANAITRRLCTPTVFRASYSNWQASHPCGKVIADDGHGTLVTIVWDEGAGDEHAAAVSERFGLLGGTTLKRLLCPFPEFDVEPYLSEIAALRPDAVFAHFAGDGAATFVEAYAAAGLKGRIPLYGSGLLTEGLPDAQAEAADGIKSTLHWAETLDNPATAAFLSGYREATGREPDVFAMHGYDTGELIVRAVETVNGEVYATAGMVGALDAVEMDASPRGPWRMSGARNPIQSVYTRTFEDGRHRLLGIAAPELEDPGIGCTLG